MTDQSRNAVAVELLCLDVDGVMTDGGIRLDDSGVETKRFHVRDGTAAASIAIRVGNVLAPLPPSLVTRSGSAVRCWTG